MAQGLIPEINDAYVGKVYGNILDMYDNPSYNLKLFMVTPDRAKEIKQEDFYLTSQVAPPNETVVLAQTGVTGTQIDDVEITSLVNPQAGTQLQCSFTIVQPGAATFLDEIQVAKAYLGYENAVITTEFFLEIRFQGYETDFDDNEEGGAPVKILGPIVYKMDLTTFDLVLDDQGSTYQMRCRIVDTKGFSDSVYRTPQTVTTTGSTITEHVESYTTALNEWQKNSTGYVESDIIEIDLSKLIGVGGDGTNSLSIITDESLLTSKDKGLAETVNRVMNETWDVRTKLEQQAALAAAPVDSGTAPEVQFDGDNLSIKEGTTIEEYMYIILSMCPEFYTKCTRKLDIDNAESGVDTSQGFVSWFKVHCKTERGPFDSFRGDYSYKYIYTPILFKNANPNIAVDPDELNPTVEDIRKRVKQYKQNGSLVKAYNYLFTGLNDQILSLDIKYDNAAGSRLPPKYGALGEISMTSQNKVSDTTPAGEDTSYAGRVDSLLGKAKEKADKSKIGNILGSLGDFVDSAEDIAGSLVGQLGATAGFTEAQLLNAISDKSQRNALLENLTSDARAALSSVSVTSSAPSTESPDVTGGGPSAAPYTPEPSGYVYSTDFIVPASEQELDAATLTELGYVQAGRVPPLPIPKDASKDIKNKAESGTAQTGSTRSKLFGFITEQNNNGNFLLKLKFTVRGDPWYLASKDLSEPTTTTANFNRDSMLFWLRIASPQKYDPDYRDEDNNEGYWKFDGTSRTFSGIYRFIRCTNNFSGGVYTVNVEAQRIFGLDDGPVTDADESTEESQTAGTTE